MRVLNIQDGVDGRVGAHPRPCDECGEPVTVTLEAGRKVLCRRWSGGDARHDLCRRCFQAALDRLDPAARRPAWRR